MGDFMKKAKNMVDKNEQKIDQSMKKAGDQLNQRTGGKYADKIGKAVAQGQQKTGSQNQNPNR